MLTGKENEMVDDNKKALTELLEIIEKHPEIVEKITVVLRPNKISQSDKKPTER